MNAVGETAAYLGVAAGEVPTARTWVAERDHDVGCVNTWTSPGPLLEFVERFVPDRTAMVLIELRLTVDGLLPDQPHTDEVVRIVHDLPKEDGPWEAFLLVGYGPEPRGPFRELPANDCELPTEPSTLTTTSPSTSRPPFRGRPFKDHDRRTFARLCVVDRPDPSACRC